MEIQLKPWQLRFQEFVLNNKNKVINLYGFPYGKTTMAVYDKKKTDRIYYHDNRDDESESFFTVYPIQKNIDDGLTVIIVTIEKLFDKNYNDFVYFEVNENDE